MKQNRENEDSDSNCSTESPRNEIWEFSHGVSYFREPHKPIFVVDLHTLWYNFENRQFWFVWCEFIFMTNCVTELIYGDFMAFMVQFGPFWTDHKSYSVLPQHHFFISRYNITHKYSKIILIRPIFHRELYRGNTGINRTNSILIWSQSIIRSGNIAQTSKK